MAKLCKIHGWRLFISNSCFSFAIGDCLLQNAWLCWCWNSISSVYISVSIRLEIETTIDKRIYNCLFKFMIVDCHGISIQLLDTLLKFVFQFLFVNIMYISVVWFCYFLLQFVYITKHFTKYWKIYFFSWMSVMANGLTKYFSVKWFDFISRAKSKLFSSFILR